MLGATGWLVASAIALAAVPVRAQVADTSLYVTDGAVSAIARDGNTIYIGGVFHQVWLPTGGAAPVNTSDGTVGGPFPGVVDGTVNAVAPDGSGGWYLGGVFRAVGMWPIRNLAHVRSNGTVVTSWNPDPDSTVTCLTVDGSTIYAGGAFSHIGGQARNRVAALDAVSGSATAWDPSADSDVLALAVGDGTVYAGGSFRTIGGQVRSRIAALDAVSGSATDWDANADSTVRALAVSGNRVFAGGLFTHIGGVAKYYLAALDATTGFPTAWYTPAGNAYALSINALVVSGNTVYAGGHFMTLRAQNRNHIAAIDATTGLVTPWDPNANGAVHCLAVSDGIVYAGGAFTSIGGQPRQGMAALDATTGSATSWDPKPRWVSPYDIAVHSLAVSGSTVFAGGRFTGLGWATREGIAALDATTGRLTPWNPDPDYYENGYVRGLVVSESTVYAFGGFTRIGGQPRNRIAALDAATGAATAWSPDANGDVHALAVSGSTVYVGGDFTSIGGQPRNRVAALDAVTGVPTAWNPDADATVNALTLSGSTIYVGGVFTRVGGTSRNFLAALDATTGAATAWDPRPNDQVDVIRVDGGTVYVGGRFSLLGGRIRSGVGQLDVLAGAATPWSAGLGYYSGYAPYVRALEVGDGWAYVGGEFNSVAGLKRPWFAGVRTGDIPTGTLLALFDAVVQCDGVLLRWRFGDATAIQMVAVERAESETGPWTRLALVQEADGGSTQALDATAEPGHVYWYRLVVSLGGAPVDLGPIRAEVPGLVTASGVTRLWPNPSTGTTHVEYAVARGEPVRLSVLDVTGREVEVLAEGSMAPGRYALVWDGHARLGALAPGVYYLRWESPGRSTSQRMVRLR